MTLAIMAKMPATPIAAAGMMMSGASVAAPSEQPTTATPRPARQRMIRSGRVIRLLLGCLVLGESADEEDRHGGEGDDDNHGV